MNFGDNWLKLSNTTSKQSVYFEFFPNGILKYFYDTGFYSGQPGPVLYYKNNTVINGQKNFELEPYDHAILMLH
jgi:hypothetical protein